MSAESTSIRKHHHKPSPLLPTIAGANNAPVPQEVRVVGCTAEPCTVQIGGLVDMDLDFVAPRATNGMRATLDIFLGTFRVPYDLPVEQQNACNFLKDGSCPLTPGEFVNYHLSTPAAAPFAGITVDLQLQLADDNGQALICFRSSARIVSG